MGLFSAYLGYRHAKKKIARRQLEEEMRAERTCTKCGHSFRQHSDRGQCPSYE